MRHQKPAKGKTSLAKGLDAIDRKILKHLVEDGRMSTLDLAEKVGLSPTPCSRRIRQLENTGVIEGYAARVDPAALGLNLCVVVLVKLSRYGPEGHAQFLKAVSERPEITECLLVSGSSDYLLRVWVEDADALREFTINALQGIPAVAETSTMLVLNQISSPLAGLR